MDILKVGIVGYGIVGKRRRKVIDKNKYMQTVAISDINFKKDFIDKDGVHVLRDFKKIFEVDLNVLFVCLPNRYASIATKLALKNNLHVFCEKPPGRHLSEVIDVYNVYKKKPHLKIKYGFNHRYHDSFIEAKKIISSERYGRVLNFRGVYGKSVLVPSKIGTWRSKRSEAGGGILLDQGIHMLDMIQLFSDEYNEIKSFVQNDYWKHNVEDNAFIIMRDKKNRVAMIHSSATEWRHKFRLEITLEKALIELSGILSGTKSYGDETFKLTKRNKNGNIIPNTKSMQYVQDLSWKKEVDEFAYIIVKNKKVKDGNITEAIRLMKLISKIYKSDKQWNRKYKIH